MEDDVRRRRAYGVNLKRTTLRHLGFCLLLIGTLPSLCHSTAGHGGKILSTPLTSPRMATLEDVEACEAKIPEFDIDNDGALQKPEFVEFVRKGLGGCYRDYSVVDGTFYTFVCQDCSSPFDSTCCVRNDNAAFDYTEGSTSFCVVLLGAIEAQCADSMPSPTQAPPSSTPLPVVMVPTDPPTATLPITRTTFPDTLSPTEVPATPSPTTALPTVAPTTPDDPTIAPSAATLAPATAQPPDDINLPTLNIRATVYFNYTVGFTIPDGLAYSTDDRKEWLVDAFDFLANETWQAIIASEGGRRRLHPRHRKLSLRTGRLRRTLVDTPTLDLPSEIVQFQPPLPTENSNCANGNDDDCWHVLHAIDLLNAGNDQIRQFRQDMEGQIEEGLFFEILQDQFVPDGVLVAIPSMIEPTAAPVTAPDTGDDGNGPDGADDDLPRDATEEEDGGLPVYAIALIGVAGALAAAILYYCCFHQTKTTPAPSESNSRRGKNKPTAVNSVPQGSFPTAASGAVPKKSNLKSSSKPFSEPPSSVSMNSHKKSDMSNASPAASESYSSTKAGALELSSRSSGGTLPEGNVIGSDKIENAAATPATRLNTKPHKPSLKTNNAPPRHNDAQVAYRGSESHAIGAAPVRTGPKKSNLKSSQMDAPVVYSNSESRAVHSSPVSNVSKKSNLKSSQIDAPVVYSNNESRAVGNVSKKSNLKSSQMDAPVVYSNNASRVVHSSPVGKVPKKSNLKSSQIDGLELSSRSSGGTLPEGNVIGSDKIENAAATPATRPNTKPHKPSLKTNNVPPRHNDAPVAYRDSESHATKTSPVGSGPRKSNLKSSQMDAPVVYSDSESRAVHSSPVGQVPKKSNLKSSQIDAPVVYSNSKSEAVQASPVGKVPKKSKLRSSQRDAPVVYTNSESRVVNSSPVGNVPKKSNLKSSLKSSVPRLPIQLDETPKVEDQVHSASLTSPADTIVPATRAKPAISKNLNGSSHHSAADSPKSSAKDLMSPNSKKSRLSLGGLRNSLINSVKAVPPVALYNPKRDLYTGGDTSDEEKMEEEVPVRISPMEAVAMVPIIRPVPAMPPETLDDEEVEDTQSATSPPSPGRSLSTHSASSSSKRKKSVAHFIDATGLVSAISPSPDRYGIHVFEDASDVMDTSASGESSSTRQRNIMYLRIPPSVPPFPYAEGDLGNVGMEKESKEEGEANDGSENEEMCSVTDDDEIGQDGVAADKADLKANETDASDNEVEEACGDRPPPPARDITGGTAISSLSAGEDDESWRQKMVSPLSMTSRRSRVVSPVSSDGEGIPDLPELGPVIDDADPYYGGVYYGEDDDDENLAVNHDNQGAQDFPEPVANEDEPVLDPEVPVYGGVYYGSDEDEASAFTGSNSASRSGSKRSQGSAGSSNKQAKRLDKKPRSGSRRQIHQHGGEEEGGLIPQSMEYFAGIKMPRKPSFTSTITSEPSASVSASAISSSIGGLPEHMYDGGEDWSVNSRGSLKSATSKASMLSADEREWQRRLREDLLHPVTEDAVIGDGGIDLALLNNSSNAASGFTGLSGFSRGTSKTGSKSGRSRRKYQPQHT